MEKNATTNEQLAAQENTESDSSLETKGEADASIEAQSDDSIPDKFRGKSFQDVIKSYRGLEGKLGQMGSERSHIEKQLEEAKARITQIEQERVQFQQQASQYRPQAEQEVDPVQLLDEEFDSDPKEALKKTISRLNERVKMTKQELQMDQRAKEANEFYAQQMRENQDFAALEGDMKRLATQYAPYVKPEQLNTKETIQLLYSLAKANNMGKYEQAAVDRYKKSSEQIRDEKKRAFSESSVSSGEGGSTKFGDLSASEMAKLLGRVEND